MTDLRDQLADFEAAEADRLAAVAVELAIRVRDHDPEANGRWLHHMLPDPADWFRLAFVLAAAIPEDRSWTHLTAWTRTRHHPGQLTPCGTHAAAQRHRYHGEELCPPCREAERARDRERKRVAYHRDRTATPDRRTA